MPNTGGTRDLESKLGLMRVRKLSIPDFKDEQGSETKWRLNRTKKRPFPKTKGKHELHLKTMLEIAGEHDVHLKPMLEIVGEHDLYPKPMVEIAGESWIQSKFQRAKMVFAIIPNQISLG